MSRKRTLKQLYSTEIPSIENEPKEAKESAKKEEDPTETKTLVTYTVSAHKKLEKEFECLRSKNNGQYHFHSLDEVKSIITLLNECLIITDITDIVVTYLWTVFEQYKSIEFIRRTHSYYQHYLFHQLLSDSGDIQTQIPNLDDMAEYLIQVLKPAQLFQYSQELSYARYVLPYKWIKFYWKEILNKNCPIDITRFMFHKLSKFYPFTYQEREEYYEKRKSASTNTQFDWSFVCLPLEHPEIKNFQEYLEREAKSTEGIYEFAEHLSDMLNCMDNNTFVVILNFIQLKVLQYCSETEVPVTLRDILTHSNVLESYGRQTWELFNSIFPLSEPDYRTTNLISTIQILFQKSAIPIIEKLIKMNNGKFTSIIEYNISIQFIDSVEMLKWWMDYTNHSDLTNRSSLWCDNIDRNIFSRHTVINEWFKDKCHNMLSCISNILDLEYFSYRRTRIGGLILLYSDNNEELFKLLKMFKMDLVGAIRSSWTCLLQHTDLGGHAWSLNDYSNAEDFDKSRQYLYLSPRRIFERYPKEAKEALTLEWFAKTMRDNDFDYTTQYSYLHLTALIDLMIHSDFVTEERINTDSDFCKVIVNLLKTEKDVFSINVFEVFTVKLKISTSVLMNAVLRFCAHDRSTFLSNLMIVK